MTAFRKAVDAYTGSKDSPVWIGETGWSSPCSGSQTYMEDLCRWWCSTETLGNYYKNFLQWDGSLNDGVNPVDLMFYFTNRDVNDYGYLQAFGLVNNCFNPNCKVQ